ncbi:MAG: hypothetical protein ACYDAS_02830 [Patescibacteria group bacterium]
MGIEVDSSNPDFDMDRWMAQRRKEASRIANEAKRSRRKADKAYEELDQYERTLLSVWLGNGNVLTWEEIALRYSKIIGTVIEGGRGDEILFFELERLGLVDEDTWQAIFHEMEDRLEESGLFHAIEALDNPLQTPYY